MADRRAATAVLVLALGAGGIGLLLGTVLSGGNRTGSGPAGSTYATSEGGAKAAYLMLSDLGYRVERRAEPIGRLARTRLAFVLAPEARLDRVDLVGLRHWIEGGGVLVYGLGLFEPDGETLRQGLALPPLAVSPLGSRKAALAGDWAPARHLLLRLGVDQMAEGSGGVTALARDGHATRALAVTRGKGRIYLVDAGVFSNRGLAEEDNALFLAVLAAHHGGGGPIVFDEFVHGYGDPVSLLSIAAWPLRLGAGALALALVLYALAAGRRLGPPSPEPAPPRRASIEQIEALAAFFAARNSRVDALAALAAHAGVRPPDSAAADDAAFVAEARSLLAAAAKRVAPGRPLGHARGDAPPRG